MYGFLNDVLYPFLNAGSTSRIPSSRATMWGATASESPRSSAPSSSPRLRSTTSFAPASGWASRPRSRRALAPPPPPPPPPPPLPPLPPTPPPTGLPSAAGTPQTAILPDVHASREAALLSWRSRAPRCLCAPPRTSVMRICGDRVENGVYRGRAFFCCPLGREVSERRKPLT